jgi:hypothetical protein
MSYENRKTFNELHNASGSSLNILGAPLHVNIVCLAVEFLLCLIKYTFTDRQGTYIQP